MSGADRMTSVRGVIDIMTGGWRAQTLYTAVRLGLPDLIDAGHVTSADLAAATGAQEDGIRRLMRLLIADKVFAGGPDDYANTELSAVLRTGPDSLSDMCLLYGEQFYVAWQHAHRSLTQLESGFEEAYGEPLYGYLGARPDVAARFQRTMNAGSMFFDRVAEAFDFAGKTIVDVGGGGGELLASLLAAVPTADGVLFDRQHMMPRAEEHLAREVGLERVRMHPGDMFESVPADGDVYIMSRILAGWSDDLVVQAFSNCRDAMRDTESRLLILDRFVGDDSPALLPALWDLHLLVTTGGRHRTFDEIASLLERGSFAVERTAELPMQTTAVVAKPVG